MNLARKPHESNQGTLERILQIKNEKGKSLSHTQVTLLSIVSMFSREKGCYMTYETIIKERMGDVTKKTLQSHVKYLKSIGVLQQSRENGCFVLRLKNPENMVVLSLKKFRKEDGVSSYQEEPQESVPTETCAKTETLEEETIIMNDKNREKAPADFDIESIFFAKQSEKFASETPVISTPDHRKFDLPVVKSKKELNKNYSPQTPPCDTGCDANLDLEFQLSQNEQRQDQKTPCDGLKETKTTEDEFTKIWGDDVRESAFPAEPLPPAPRGTRAGPRNQREARAEAHAKYAAGHLTKPTGRKILPKRIQWQSARDIDLASDATVTIPQLTKHLILAYANTYGDEEIVVNMLPMTLTAMTSFFGELRQSFVVNARHEATNRELAMYLTWFLEPGRQKILFKVSKYTSQAAPHVRMLKGALFVRKFFDEVLTRKVSTAPALSASSTQRELLHYNSEVVIKAFNEMRDAKEDNDEIVVCLYRHGFVLVGQFMKDELAMTESQCKGRIIDAMSKHLRGREDKADAIEFLRAIEKTTEVKSQVYEDCMWQDYKEKTSGFVDLAVEISNKLV